MATDPEIALEEVGTLGPSPFSISDVLKPACSSAEEAARASMQRKIQAGHIVNWHGANQMYLNACHLANTMGLTPDQKLGISPFPHPSNVTVVDNSLSRDLVGLLNKFAPSGGSTSPEVPTVTPTSSGTGETTSPVVLAVTPVSVPISAPVSTNLPTTSDGWWAWVFSHWKGIGSTILAALGLLGSGYTAWNWNGNNGNSGEVQPTQVISAPADVSGRIGVTIE